MFRECLIKYLDIVYLFSVYLVKLFPLRQNLGSSDKWFVRGVGGGGGEGEVLKGVKSHSHAPI